MATLLVYRYGKRKTLRDSMDTSVRHEARPTIYVNTISTEKRTYTTIDLRKTVDGGHILYSVVLSADEVIELVKSVQKCYATESTEPSLDLMCRFRAFATGTK